MVTVTARGILKIIRKKVIVLLFFSVLFSFEKFCIAQQYDRKGIFRFVVIGCTHIGICDPEEFELALEKIKDYKPEFILLLGGMIDSASDSSVELLWKKFDFLMERVGVPVYNIPSDCSLIPLSAPSERMKLMEKYFLERYKKSFYNFTYKNNLFIGLDSKRIISDNGMNNAQDNEQVNFLAETLSRGDKCSNIFIFTHNSPWTDNDYSRNGWFEYIHPLIKGKVKYVFGAHTHYLDFKNIDDVNYVTCGSPPLKEYLVARPSFFHFLVVDVNGDNISIGVVPLRPIPLKVIKTDNNTGKDNSLLPTYAILKTIKSFTLDSSERQFALQRNRIMEALRIRPGMEIVDIGAGTGFFTFPFADALKGAGKVYATEVDQEMLGHIKGKVKDGNYENIVPVLVKAEGLDQFYRQHSFDIIFLSEVYHVIDNPENYLRELRLSLKKENGRLYIVEFKNIPDFSEVEFDDFKNVQKILESEGESFPIFQRMDGGVQDFIRENRHEVVVPHDIKARIVSGFNKMLTDRYLFNDLMEYYAVKEAKKGLIGWGEILEKILYPEFIRLAKWIIVNLNEEGVFTSNKKLNSAVIERELRELNRLLITGIFKSYTFTYLTGKIPIYLERQSIISTLEDAGYAFVADHKLQYHHFLEFKRKY